MTTDTAAKTSLHIGNRVLAARSLRGVSQQSLANELGVTLERVQKYEEGESLTSAGRLYDVARALEVDVAYFYEGLPGATSCPFFLSSERYMLLRRAVQRIAADNEVTQSGHRKRLARDQAIKMAREVCEALGWTYGKIRNSHLPRHSPAVK